MTPSTIPAAEIFSQGEEVVSGQIADTNAAWLSQQLIDIGFDVTRHTAVGDRLSGLRELLTEIATRADCCLCTGGLGPTQDDLTAEAVAQAFGLELSLDPIALESIQARYARSAQPMPEVNRKQAFLPQGALRLDNHWGTAPGFALRAERCWFAFMPGVPREMRAMFERWVVPELQRRFILPPRKRVTLRCVGIGESALQERLDSLHVPHEIIVGFRAVLPEVHVKLLFPEDWADDAVASQVASVHRGLGTEVFAVDGADGQQSPLAPTVGRLLRERNATLAVAESVSGGLLASQCAGEPWFLQSLVMPDGTALCRHFGMAAPDSAATTAEKLAVALRRQSGADYALAQISDESSPTAPVHFALATADGALSIARPLSAGKERAQPLAAAYSLDLLRRYLQGLALT